VPLNESKTGDWEAKLIAGRKLLLADDSAAVQKVVELTFADEGMEVVSVGDGQSALDKLEHLTPDVVLADAIMPGLSGYELCRSMKDDQRFAKIPVMLLVSSFAPFDEAEAQRAGADDVITKPFQSIRQLVNRVDSLLSDKQPAVDRSIDPTMEFREAEDTTPIPVELESDEPKVTVLVEAAQLETAPTQIQEGGACAPDIEFQTADTAKLEPEAAAFRAGEYDTLEVEPQMMVQPTPPEIKSDIRMNDNLSMNEPARSRFSDALLDLDDSEFAASAIADEVVLDLDFDAPPGKDEQRSWDLTSTQGSRSVEPQPLEVEQSAVGEMEASPAASPDETNTVSSKAEEAPTGPLAYPPGATFGQPELSPEVINAIARRVIEQMSDQVVREIAWEVVPELSELMIRKKLDQS
jgi:CheY-like chemotaxis protein